MHRPSTRGAPLRNAGDAFRKANAGSTAAHSRGKDIAEVGQTLRKTRLCKFFLSGRCRRGQACTFAHGEEALQPQPDLFKTQLCFQHLKTGICFYGESCSFAHSKEELRSVAPGVATNDDDDMTSDEDAFSFKSKLEPLRNGGVNLRSQSGALEDDEHADHASHASKGSGNCFSGVVSNAFSSIGTLQNVAYFGLSPMPSAATMAAQRFVPVAVVMPEVQERSAPVVEVGRRSVGQCECSGMPQSALRSVLSQQTTEILSSSGSFGFIEEDDGWTSAASVSAGSLEQDSQAEEDVEVEAAIVVENTFITLKPVSDSMTKSELPRVRSASAPPLNRCS